MLQKYININLVFCLLEKLLHALSPGRYKRNAKTKQGGLRQSMFSWHLDLLHHFGVAGAVAFMLFGVSREQLLRQSQDAPRAALQETN